MFRLTNKIRNCRVGILNRNRGLKFKARKKIADIKKTIKKVRESDKEDNRKNIMDLKIKSRKAYKDEELFWSQKARIKWLKEDDQNTNFIHIAVCNRRKETGFPSYRNLMKSGVGVIMRL
ncbi:hypothetical protein ACH5RR_032257 [Cinchona calisaya]|uniref:Uncharacterized protein n=1 Tax=Cinchona calisaya TaxID=153742 RepID=A0ABD2YLT9_9GENT